MKRLKQNFFLISLLFLSNIIWASQDPFLTTIASPVVELVQRFPDDISIKDFPGVDQIPMPGPIKKAVSNLKFDRPQVRVLAGAVVITGTVNFFGQPVTAKFRIGRDFDPTKVGEKAPKAEKDITESVVREVQKRIGGGGPKAQPKPAETTAVATDKSLVEQAAKGGTAGEASGTIAGEPKKSVKDKIKRQIEGTKLKLSLGIELPQGWSWSKISPLLAWFDLVNLTRGGLLLSDHQYFDPDWGSLMRPGLNFLGEMAVGGPVADLSKMVKNAAQLKLSGVITPSITGSILTAELPGFIEFGRIQAGSLIFRLTLATPNITFGIGSSIKIDMPNQPDPLIFTGLLGLSFPLAQWSIDAYMDGMWEDPFGIPGPKIGNVKLKIVHDPTIASATIGIGSITGLGIGGEIGFGSKSIAVAVYGDLTTTPNVVIMGELIGGLFLDDLVDFGFGVVELGGKIVQKAVKTVSNPKEIVRKINAVKKCALSKSPIKRFKDFDVLSCPDEPIFKTPKPSGFDKKLKEVKNAVKKAVPNIGIRELRLLVAPRYLANFGGVSIRKGIDIAITAELFDIVFKARAAINQVEGITILGTMSELKLGPVVITGAGEDQERGTEDDGPIISLQLPVSANLSKLARARIFLDGRLELNALGGFVLDTTVSVSADGLYFKLLVDLANQFKTELELSAPIRDPLGWFVQASMQQEGLSNFSKLVKKAGEEVLKQGGKVSDTIGEQRKKFQRENKKNIEKARERVRKRLEKIEKLEKKLKKQMQRCLGKTPSKDNPEIEVELEGRASKPLKEKDIQAALKTFKDDGLVDAEIKMIEKRLRKRMKRQKAAYEKRKKEARAKSYKKMEKKARREYEKKIEKEKEKLEKEEKKKREKAKGAKSKKQKEIELEIAQKRRKKEIDWAELAAKREVQIKFASRRRRFKDLIDDLERDKPDKWKVEKQKLQGEIKVAAAKASKNIQKVESKYKIEQEKAKAQKKLAGIEDEKKREKKEEKLEKKIEKKEKKQKKKIKKRKEKIEKVAEKQEKKVAKKEEKEKKKEAKQEKKKK